MKKLIANYIKVIEPEYCYLQLIPNNSIRNYNSDKIAKAINVLYSTLPERIRRQDKKILFYKPTKVGYYVYMDKNNVEFYFIVPANRLNLIKDKINDTWKGITVKEVDIIPELKNNPAKYYLTYRKEDAISLATDKRTNTLLSSKMNVLDIMDGDDRLAIYYNLAPTTQYTWRSEYEKTMEKIKSNLPVDKEKFNYIYILKSALIIILQTVGSMLNAVEGILGTPNVLNVREMSSRSSLSEFNFLNLNNFNVSKATKSKKDSTILDTQILVLSESSDRLRKDNNAIATCHSFKSISEDNELVYRKIKYNIIFDESALKSYKLNKVGTIKTSTKECQNFISLPGKELLDEYNFVEKVDTYESQVPKELKNGVMCIGENTYRGKPTKAYLTNDFEYKNLTLAVIAPTRAGKSTLLQNLCNDALKNGECVIVPDFISNNQLSSELEEVAENKLIIDCGNLEKLEGMGYNETWGFARTPIERYDTAKEQTVQLLNLIDCINESDKSLSAKMDRYLEAAANIVFVSYGSVGDVHSVLRNHKERVKFINKIPEKLKVYYEEYIETMNELNEKNRNGEVSGTKTNLIAGILDRFNRLRRNTAMEIMLKNDCKNNINLLEEIQKPQIISIKIPERRYKTDKEKDFITTYWLSKLWQSLQIRDDIIPDRKKRIKVNLIIDELYQVPQAQRLLTEKLSQLAKFDCKTIISCHYLGQIPTIRDELKAANTSYMLISGVDKDNFRELKEELNPYELEDVLNLKRYHSLNLIKYENGYAKFITKLPKPVNK